MTSIWEPLSHVCTWEALGYVASALVLAAFYMKEMVPLRIAALASNLSFIAYGAALGLTPIWLLHLLLLPMNGCRLAQALRLRRSAATAQSDPACLGRPERAEEAQPVRLPPRAGGLVGPRVELQVLGEQNRLAAF
jgi:hypothetical protein